MLADITSPRERGVLTATNDLIVAFCAAIASLAAGGLLSAARLLVGRRRVRRRSSCSRVPGLLRLREPTVGTYEEAPAAALAGTPV